MSTGNLKFDQIVHQMSVLLNVANENGIAQFWRTVELFNVNPGVHPFL